MPPPEASLSSDPSNRLARGLYRATTRNRQRYDPRVLEGGGYLLGREVESFEAAFADCIGAAHAVGCASGTNAIELASRACDDLVFTVSHTAVATVTAIERAGATAVLIDVEPGFYTMDPHELSRTLRAPPPGRPAAMLPVHPLWPASRTRCPPRACPRLWPGPDRGLRSHGALYSIADNQQDHSATSGALAFTRQRTSVRSAMVAWSSPRIQLLPRRCVKFAIWLARALCQRPHRHQFAPQSGAGGGPRR